MPTRFPIRLLQRAGPLQETARAHANRAEARPGQARPDPFPTSRPHGNESRHTAPRLYSSGQPACGKEQPS